MGHGSSAKLCGPCLKLIAVFYAVTISKLCYCCGITTHTEIGFRAMEYLPHTDDGVDYKKLLLANQDAFEAGNPYPDAYYSNICFMGEYHSVSEDTHWAEFLNATILYIREHYPLPWDQGTQKLVAFTLGFVSHQVADISWHSLGIDQGFLEAMGYVDFYGSYDNAHSVGDPGGDVVNLFREDLSYSDPVGDWYVPTADLLNIYQEFYQKQVVTEEMITDCTTMLFLGRLGERIAFAKIFPKFASESPFLVDNLDKYFLGGQYDMAVWTNRIWNATIRMLQEGTSDCSVPHNPLFIRCPDGGSQRVASRSSSRGEKRQRNGYYLRPEYYGFRDDGTNAFGLSKSSVILERHGRGVSIRATPTLRTLAQEVLINQSRPKSEAPIQTSLPVAAGSNTFYPVATLDASRPYARLGECVITADLNGDGDDDLIVSAPGYGEAGNPEQGEVYVIYGVQNITSGSSPMEGTRTIESVTDVTLSGLAYQSGRFGSALAVVDLNADGIPDLAVSSPTLGSADLSYRGIVSVFFGRRGLPLSTTPDIIIECTLDYCNFGSTLAGCDLNGDGYADLVVGAPHAPGPAGAQSGFVSVYFSGPDWKPGTIINQASSDWTSYGKQAFEWYGSSLYGITLPEFGTYLFIGAPNHRLCARADCSFSPEDVQSAGVVYMFSAKVSFEMVYEFLGGASQAKVGSAIAVGRPFGTDAMLAVSSPSQGIVGCVAGKNFTFNQAGGVTLYNLTALILNSSSLPVASYYGDRLFGRFGKQSQFADVNDDGTDELYLAAPLYTDDFTEELHPGEQGIVVMYANTATSAFPIGNATTESCGSKAPLIIPCTESIAAASFRYSVNEANLGAALSAGRTQHTGFLALGAPRSAAGGCRLGGSIAIYTGFL